jgi:hypothetical protein
LGGSLPELLGSSVVVSNVSPVLVVDAPVLVIGAVVVVGAALLVDAPEAPVVAPPVAPVVVGEEVFAPVGPVVGVVDCDGVGPADEGSPVVSRTVGLVEAEDVVGALVELVPSPQPPNATVSTTTDATRDALGNGFW